MCSTGAPGGTDGALAAAGGLHGSGVGVPCADGEPPHAASKAASTRAATKPLHVPGRFKICIFNSFSDEYASFFTTITIGFCCASPSYRQYQKSTGSHRLQCPQWRV